MELKRALQKVSKEVWAAHPNNPKNKPRAARVRLTKNDWKLIEEALDMLGSDYDGAHPEQERINYLVKIATDRS